MTISITLVLLVLLGGGTSGRMLDPNGLTFPRRNGDLDKNVLSLTEDEEEEERVHFGSLLTGEEVGENEKDNFEKVEGEAIQDFEGDLFVF